MCLGMCSPAWAPADIPEPGGMSPLMKQPCAGLSRRSMWSCWIRKWAAGWQNRCARDGSRRTSWRSRLTARVCEARQEDGRAVQLFAAMVNREGVVLAQREVDHKTNEITAFRPLLEPLDLEGVVVTADAMHAQVDHANFLVDEKGADYVFTVKANQPGLLDTLAALDDGSFSPSPH